MWDDIILEIYITFSERTVLSFNISFGNLLTHSLVHISGNTFTMHHKIDQSRGCGQDKRRKGGNIQNNH